MRYSAGPSITIADFVLASYIGNYLVNPASPVSQLGSEILHETPLFKAYTTIILEEFTYLKKRPPPGPL